MTEERLEYEYSWELPTIPAKHGTFEPLAFHSGVLPWKLSWYLSACKLYCDPEMENPPWKVEILFRIRFLSENKTILQEVETSHIFEKESNVTTQKGWRFLVENVELVKFISLEMLIVDFAGLRTNVEKSVIFTRPSDRSNCELIVGKRRFYVNLDILSMHSTYFNDLRLSQTNIPGANPVLDLQLNEKQADYFVFILKMIFYRTNVLNRFNVFHLADLAKKFCLDTVLKKCEEFLVDWQVESKAQALQYLEMSAVYGFYKAMHNAKRFLDLTGEEHMPMTSVATSDVCDLPYLSRRVAYKGCHLNQLRKLTVIVDWVFKYKEKDGKIHVSICPTFANRSCTNWEIDAGIRVQFGEHTTKERLVFSFNSFKHVLQLPKPTECDLAEIESETNIQVFSARGVRYHMVLEDSLLFQIRDKTTTVKLQLADGVLYSNLQYLAHFSGYFMEQLKKAGSLPVEDELPVVALADVCKEVLHPILRHIYPNYRIPAPEMRTAIPLADKLLFTGVLIHCEQHLVPTDLEELQVAVDARMNSVMKRVKSPLPPAPLNRSRASSAMI